MVADLGVVRTHSWLFPGERRGDVYHVVRVVAHDQQNLPDAVGGEARRGVSGIVQRPRRAEVTSLDDRVTDGAAIRVKLRDPAARGSAIWVIRHDGVRPLLPNQAGRWPGHSRSVPG